LPFLKEDAGVITAKIFPSYGTSAGRVPCWSRPSAALRRCALTLPLCVTFVSTHAQSDKSTSTPLSSRAADRHLVIISVDGLIAQTALDTRKLGLDTPNLNEMREGGAAAEGLVGVFPTLTYPSHTTLVTGRDPAEHGIVSNPLFDPEGKIRGAWMCFSELIQVPTLWDAAHSAHLTTAGVFWPVTVGTPIDWNLPEFGQPESQEQLLLQHALSTPGLFAKFEKAEDTTEITSHLPDSRRGRQAAFLIRNYKPNLMLVHLTDLDHEEHVHGPGSQEAYKTLESIDKAIGEIRRAVDEAGLSDRTSFLIVSDHGFLPLSKDFQPNAFLNSLGLAAEASKPNSWRVAAQITGGTVSFRVRDPKDETAKALVQKTLERLPAEGTGGIGTILDRAELEKRHAFPNAFLAVSLAPGYTNGSAQSGPWVTSSGETRGMHGYLPGPQELDATFIA
jgi:predicted AlkP superfamily pyrophosphatase or phosphodiesterase